MAITRRTSNGVIETFSGTAGTGHTINLSDAAIGDVRTCEISGNPDGTGAVGSLTLPTGWNWVGTQTETGAASTGMLSVIYRVVQSGDTLTSATLSLTYNNSVMVQSTAETWEGVDTTTPLDQTVPAYATGSSPPVSPSITTQTDGALLICAAQVDGAPTWGDGDIPSGFTLNGTASNNPPSNGQNHGSAYLIQATAGASGTKSWTNGGTEEYVAMTYALRPTTAGIDTVTDPFDFDTSSVTITGQAFGATESSSTVHLSPNDLLSEAGEVDISAAVNTWSDTSINLDMTLLSAGTLTSLHTMGPGDRFVIVNVGGVPGTTEYFKDVTVYRPHAFKMSLGAGTPGATTARLAAPATKTTADFDAGRFEEAANPATTVDITADDYTEMVWSIEAKTLARDVQYDFRVTESGTVLNTYTVTPKTTVTSGAEIIGDIDATTTIAATLAYNQNPSITGSISAAVTIAALLAFNQNPSIAGDIDSITTVGAVMEYNRNPEITGDIQSGVAIASVMEFNQNPSITGDIAADTTIAALLDYTQNPSITGAINANVSIGAILAYNQNKLITGDIQADVSINSAMAYASGKAIVGDIAANVTITSLLEYNQNHLITGNIQADTSINGLTDFTRNASITGNIASDVTISSVMFYASGNSILGSITANASINALMDYTRNITLTGDIQANVSVNSLTEYNQNPVIAGDIQSTVMINGLMQFNSNYLITGSIAASTTVAAVMLYESQAGIIGNIQANVSIDGLMVYNQNPFIIGDIVATVSVNGITAYSQALFTNSLGYGAGSVITNDGIGQEGFIINDGLGVEGEITYGYGVSAIMSNKGIGRESVMSNDGLGKEGEL